MSIDEGNIKEALEAALALQGDCEITHKQNKTSALDNSSAVVMKDALRAIPTVQ